MNPLLKRFQHKNWKRSFITGWTQVRTSSFEFTIQETVEKMGVFGDISMLFDRDAYGRYDHPMIRDLWHRYLAFCDGCEISYVPGSVDANRMFFRGFVTQSLREKCSLVLGTPSVFKDDYHELMYQVWEAAMKARYPQG